MFRCAYDGHATGRGEKAIRLPIHVRPVKNVHFSGLQKGGSYLFSAEYPGREVVREAVFCAEHARRVAPPSVAKMEPPVRRHHIKAPVNKGRRRKRF